MRAHTSFAARAVALGNEKTLARPSGAVGVVVRPALRPAVNFYFFKKTCALCTFGGRESLDFSLRPQTRERRERGFCLAFATLTHAKGGEKRQKKSEASRRPHAERPTKSTARAREREKKGARARPLAAEGSRRPAGAPTPLGGSRACVRAHTHHHHRSKQIEPAK